MQKLQIIGNLGSDAVVKDINGKKAINFSVAVSESYKNKEGVKVEKTDWYNCSRWVDAGGSAEVAKYLTKGTKVFAEGKLSAQTYVTKENKTGIDLRLSVSFLELIGGAKKEGETSTATPAQSTAGNSEVTDDLPF